jgi:hypothetical protein
MAIYQTTVDITKGIPLLPLLKEYTGEEVADTKRDLISTITEVWGILTRPTFWEVYPSSVARPEVEPLKERGTLVLPERLINPHYGSAELELNLQKLAGQAPGIEKVWEITKNLPSLTELLFEERNNE